MINSLLIFSKAHGVPNNAQVEHLTLLQLSMAVMHYRL